MPKTVMGRVNTPDQAQESTPDEAQQRLAERIRRAILGKYPSLRAFCKDRKVPYRTLQGYVSGEKAPSWVFLADLSDATSVSVDALVGRGDAPSGTAPTREVPSTDWGFRYFGPKLEISRPSWDAMSAEKIHALASGLAAGGDLSEVGDAVRAKSDARGEPSRGTSGGA